MTLASGLAAQAGIKLPETSYGTYTAPDTFFPLVNETVAQKIDHMESKSILAGRRTWASGQWAAGNVTCEGNVGLELDSLSIGKLLKAAFGAVTTAGSGPYTHTFVPGDLADDFFTLQIGRPDVAGTVQPFSYLGCQVDQWEIACAVGEFATMGLGIVAKSETTGSALASASYASGIKPIPFTGASVTLAGSGANVKKVTLKGDNKLDKDRRFLGSGTISQPLEADLREYTGTLDMEFESLTNYARFTAGTETALVITLAAGSQSLAITLNVRYDGETPNVADRGLTMLGMPFKAVGASTDAGAITAVWSSSEATP